MAGKSIAVASDHAGYDLKLTLKEELLASGWNVLDLGADGTKSVDYPDLPRRASVFLETKFEGGCHQRRVDKLSLPQ